MSTTVVEEKPEIAQPVKVASPITGFVPPVEHRWQPGQSGNPRGRPPAGLSVAEWWNVMQDWTRAQVRQVIRDKRAPLNKVHAARQMLQAASAKTTKVGQPIAGEALDRICDRTVGKPKQSMESRHTEESVHVQVNVDLAQCLRHFEAFGKPQLPHVEPDKPSEG